MSLQAFSAFLALRTLAGVSAITGNGACEFWHGLRCATGGCFYSAWVQPVAHEFFAQAVAELAPTSASHRMPLQVFEAQCVGV